MKFTHHQEMQIKICELRWHLLVLAWFRIICWTICARFLLYLIYCSFIAFVIPTTTGVNFRTNFINQYFYCFMTSKTLTNQTIIIHKNLKMINSITELSFTITFNLESYSYYDITICIIILVVIYFPSMSFFFFS